VKQEINSLKEKIVAAALALARMEAFSAYIDEDDGTIHHVNGGSGATYREAYINAIRSAAKSLLMRLVRLDCTENPDG